MFSASAPSRELRGGPRWLPAHSTIAHALVAAFAPTVSAQFGGPGGGYNPPAPNCPAFKCPSGQVAVGKADHQIWSYGCKDADVNTVFSMADFDINDPMKSLNKQKGRMNKCCVERDICKQTCGMTSKACHEVYQKCTKKVCKNDQQCALQAMMADIMSEPGLGEEKFDPEASKCRAYDRGQKEACTCVPKGDFKSSTETKLKAFYTKFNPDKLSADGEIKDVEEVWKKWKGKEAEMFMALATKYKENSVVIREKPTRGPSEYGGSSASKPSEPPEEEEEVAEPATEKPPAPAEKDAEAAAFETQRAKLESKKQRAMKEEEYDVAQEAKDELSTLAKAEVKRLEEKKKQAVQDEDFLEAKKLKARIAKLSEL